MQTYVSFKSYNKASFLSSNFLNCFVLEICNKLWHKYVLFSIEKEENRYRVSLLRPQRIVHHNRYRKMEFWNRRSRKLPWFVPLRSVKMLLAKRKQRHLAVFWRKRNQKYLHPREKMATRCFSTHPNVIFSVLENEHFCINYLKEWRNCLAVDMRWKQVLRWCT